MKETDVAAAAVRLLQSEGWETFEEVIGPQNARRADGGICLSDDPTVAPRSRSSRIDIVATRGDELLIVEAKASWSFEVMGQAAGWNLPLRAIAVPTKRVPSPLKLGCALEYFGLGVIGVEKIFHPPRIVAEWHVPPPWLPGEDREAVAAGLRAKLTEHHKTGAGNAEAGTSGGGYITPYRLTMMKVRDFVRDNPGCTTKDIIGSVGRGHYSSKTSARSSLPRVLQTIEPWCQCVRDGKRWRFYEIKEAP